MELAEIRTKLEALIKERGISMRALSLRAGLQHNAVSNILYRNQARINFGNLEKILNALGVAFADFWQSGKDAVAPPPISPPASMQISAPPMSSVMVPDCGIVPAGPFRLTEPDSTQRFFAG